ncbi:DUF1697 domain-containing protein [Yonghaparkia sp. Root332]|uniref:DUF1697 domain-containing protein n=1 Tax=Yonghaparkia sp. Root332 TaxID=1736516 RepID=UPI0006FDCC39|nr:DUF1697 domain-containing protein [Yonghaparkia sp. Root332]KQV26438.1 hypothetical protein ASC54_06035 [Yonghaparkia sp. Root332]
MPDPCVALLRAVNLGARNKVPQRPLAEALEAELGVPVRHYLQSGNVLVASGDPAAVGARVAASIRAQTGLEIPVIVRTLAELESLAASNPWPDVDPVRVHLAVWDERPDAAALAAVRATDWTGDEHVIDESSAWMRFADASRTAKLGAAVLERRLSVVATARNARTIAELVERLRALAT